MKEKIKSFIGTLESDLDDMYEHILDEKRPHIDNILYCGRVMEREKIINKLIFLLDDLELDDLELKDGNNRKHSKPSKPKVANKMGQK